MCMEMSPNPCAQRKADLWARGVWRAMHLLGWMESGELQVAMACRQTTLWLPVSRLSPRKLKGGVHQWVAILRKHDSGTGTRLGRR